MNRFLDLIFPRRCILCDGVLLPSERGTCTACTVRIRPVRPPFCTRCGKQLSNVTETPCKDCTLKEQEFEAGRGALLYEDAIRESVYRFKYHGRKEYAAYYAELIERGMGAWIKGLHAEALIPIPLHSKRYEKRGYNQAELIASALSKRLGIPLRTDILYRLQATGKQKELNASARENNLKKAFKTYRNDVKLDTAILVDDIYTTGATVNAAARCLKSAGVRKVYFVTLCIGRNI